MIVKGTYTSVWDDEIFLTSGIEADTEKRTFKLAPMPKVPGLEFCTREYVKLPWNSKTLKFDPNGDTMHECPACKKEEKKDKLLSWPYFTY